MNKLAFAAVLLFQSALSFAQADRPASELPETVAEIDGEPVTRAEFLGAAVDWYGRDVMEEIVTRRVMDRAVKASGVSVSAAEVEARIDREVKAREAAVKQEHGITLADYLKQVGETLDGFRKKLRESEDFQRQILLEHMVGYAYLTEPRVQVRQIVVRDREKAEGLLRQLREGADFTKLAERESDDAFSAERGGLMGLFIRGLSRMGDDFESAAFGLKNPGDLSPIVSSPRGFHLLKLVKLLPADPRTFEDIRAQVTAASMDRGVLVLWIQRLRRDHARNVKYFDDRVDPAKAPGKSR